MEQRPRIRIAKSVVQRGFDGVGVLLLFLSLVYLLLEWSSVPDRVPIHFAARGEVDTWGPKISLILLPIVGLILWSALAILERYPHVYNYIVNITKGNAELQYRSAVLFIHFLKNTIAMLFAYLTVESIQIAKGVDKGLAGWVMPLFLTMIFGAIIIYMVHSFKWR
ncbi:DUF1648 domain-containing protein [Pseudalkalibacillus hwajinpoensis]|uniref:DUF1648 domain-containing protein n=1 Tax=Guptibacillus hwajinpoensis TaxID=208199 RepID=UPI001CFF3244|nr:DUF1648 domain-containing protein [Pseudalkalibacillus hwajinpoensis]